MRLIKSTLVLSLIVWLSGCVAIPSVIDNTKPTATISKRDGHGRPIGDSIAKFAVNTHPGMTGNVTLSDGRIVNVRVGNDYFSALGKNCRVIWISSGKGRAERNAVCYTDTSWKTVLAW